MGGMNNLWYVGVLLEIVSTMSGTIGKQLIRLSEQLKKSNPRSSLMCFKLGLVVNTVVGPVVDMAAYSFAAQSMIAPFGGLDVVWNALLAPWLLRETLTRRRIFGCGLIVIGTAMAGAFGNHTDSDYTLEYLEETLINKRVAIYFAVFAVWFCFNRFYLMLKPKGSALRGISLGCTAGTIAGNMFCVKAAIECIQRSIHEQEGEIWLHWLPYLLLAGAAFFALTNVIYMTKGLQEYEALFMVTIYEGSMIVSGCVSGAVVLTDLKGLEPWRITLYSISVLIVVAGMIVIFSQERQSKSSMAAGTASIQIQDSPSRRNTITSLINDLDERTLHASCAALPSEVLSPAPSRDGSPVAAKIESRISSLEGGCSMMQPRVLEAQLAATETEAHLAQACGLKVTQIGQQGDSEAGKGGERDGNGKQDTSAACDADAATDLESAQAGANRSIQILPPLSGSPTKLNL